MFFPPRRSNNKEYYNTLGINVDATEKEIKSAYRKKALSLHPDKGGDENEFKKVSEAYNVLSDPTKKKHYDNFGADGINNSKFDIFDQMFGTNKNNKSPDVTVKIEISLEEVYSGCIKKISYNRTVIDNSKAIKKCDDCNGKGIKNN